MEQKVYVLAITENPSRVFADHNRAAETMAQEFLKSFNDFCGVGKCIPEDIIVHYDKDHASMKFNNSLDDSDNLYWDITECTVE